MQKPMLVTSLLSETLSTDSDVDDDSAVVLLTATFKCIGVTRDPSYQDSLLAVHKLMKEGKSVPIKLVPEPTNPFDSRAISFQCQLNGKWKVIGYVVKELCDSVHDALSNQSITCTKFAWVK